MINILTKYNETDVKLIGNKAINLLKMAKHGINIPETWIYESTVPIKVLKEAELYREGVELKDFKQACEVFDNLSEQKVKAIKEDVMEFVSTHTGTFALRSSNSAEDIVHKSFAGAFRSKINVKKPMSIVDSIIDIWKSSFNDTVYELCLKYDIDKIEPCIVIIQKMINAEVGGIAFKMKDRCIVHAGFGMTKGAVDNTYEPDCWVIEDGRIIDRIKGRKQKGVYPVHTRTTPLAGEKFPFIYLNTNYSGIVSSSIEQSLVTINIPCKISKQFALFDEQVYDLYNVFESAGIYGKIYNYDIEWCLDHSGEIFLLQIREAIDSLVTYTKGENAIPLVSGRATGIVKYVGSYEDAKCFLEGTIVAAKKIDGPVLHAVSKAKGCIIETLELFSHSAIIARELGIPTIGVEDVKKIRQGSVYSIDGNIGEYYEIETKEMVEQAQSICAEEITPICNITRNIADCFIKLPTEWKVIERERT